MATVAVTAADEPDAPHVAAADETYVLPGSGPAAFMDAHAIVQAALDTGCDLIHPGYGFLSETVDLTEACTDAGLTVVGPTVSTLTVLGDKVLARDAAEAAGVPVPRGAEGDPTSVAALLDETGAVMLKARFGGGGRATRILRRGDDVESAVAQVSAEARVA